MSDFPPPPYPPDAPADGAPHLSEAEGSAGGEFEAALADFRRWFTEAAASPAGLPANPEGPPLDVATVLGHFVALRQEVNLQTRAARGQQEQAGDALGRLAQALELCAKAQARAEQAERAGAEEKLRPLLSTLADLYDSLATAASPIRRAGDAIVPRLHEIAGFAGEWEEPAAPARPRGTARSFWSRWILSPAADAALRAGHDAGEDRRRRADEAAEACRQVEQALATLLTGYTMNLERIARSLRKHGLEPIPAVGETFDPEQMEVIEAVAGSGRPAGEVLEEVQRGYTYNGRVFRFARVRVARD